MCRRDTEPERRRVKKRGKKAKRGEEWEGRGDEPHGQDNTFWRYKNECFSLAYLHGDSAPLESEREKRDERKRKKEREREREPTDFCLSYTLCGGLSERWCVASWIGQRDCQISGNSLFGFGPRNVVSSLLLIFARRLARLQ